MRVSMADILPFPKAPNTSSSWDALLIEQGKSAHLKAIFQNIREAEAFTMEGPPKRKFSAAVSHDLARLIACRVYGKACLEFVCTALIAHVTAPARTGYVGFFMPEGPAYRRTFQSSLALALQAGRGEAAVTPLETGLSLSPVGIDFVVHYERMPLMTAFFDFLVEALGFAPLDDILAPVFAIPGQETVEAAAKGLSKEVYGFLADHLPSQQMQARFRVVSGFFQETAAVNADQTSDIPKPTDAHILTLWQKTAVQEGADFKTYRGVVEVVLKYWQAMESAVGENAMRHADTMGADWEAGEREIAETDIWVQDDPLLGSEQSPLAALDEGLGQDIKVFTKIERAVLDPMMIWQSYAAEIPLTHMRWQSFGGAQARVSQALRRKEDPLPLLTEALSQTEPYDHWPAMWQDLIAHCDKVIGATAAILVANGRLEGMTLLLDQDSEARFEPITDLVKGHALDEVAEVLPKLVLSPQNVTGLSDVDHHVLQKVMRAFKDIARQGFKQLADVPAETLDGLEICLPVVRLVKKQLQALHRKVQDTFDLETEFAHDSTRFEDTMTQLYATPNKTPAGVAHPTGDNT